MKEISWADSSYMSILSVTTMSYGDKHFNTLSGKYFATIWLLQCVEMLITILRRCDRQYWHIERISPRNSLHILYNYTSRNYENRTKPRKILWILFFSHWDASITKNTTCQLLQQLQNSQYSNWVTLRHLSATWQIRLCHEEQCFCNQ